MNCSAAGETDAGGTLLILSDGKPGHVNQSIAFARLLNLAYEVRRVQFRNRFCKALSYLFDRIGLSVHSLFQIEGDIAGFDTVVSAGSETYYANRHVARRLGAKSVAIMLPKGYRYAFDLIIAQRHDQPPRRRNILTLPVNLSCPEPQRLVERIDARPCISLVIGGPSRHFQMGVDELQQQLQKIYQLFPGADFLATTSRRTPKDVEALVEAGPFRYKVIASRDNVNPVADFLAISDYVFVTGDSTSMISEAVCFGDANVEVLPLQTQGKSGKIQRMIESLCEENYLHIYDGYTGNGHRKLDLREMLREVWP